jgi:hypothetical protein
LWWHKWQSGYRTGKFGPQRRWRWQTHIHFLYHISNRSVDKCTELQARFQFRLDLFGRPGIHDFMLQYFFRYLIRRFTSFSARRCCRSSGGFGGGNLFRSRLGFGLRRLSGALFLDALDRCRGSQKAIDGLPTQHLPSSPQGPVDPVGTFLQQFGRFFFRLFRRLSQSGLRMRVRM